jgi:hypothetical protein
MLSSVSPRYGVGLTYKEVRVRNRSVFNDLVEGDVVAVDLENRDYLWNIRGGDPSAVWANVTQWRTTTAPTAPLMVDCGIPLVVKAREQPAIIGQVLTCWLWHPDILVHFHQVDSSGGVDNERFPGDHGIVHAIPPSPPDHVNLSLEWTDDFLGISAHGTRTVARAHEGRPDVAPATPGHYIRATFNGWEELWAENGA